MKSIRGLLILVILWDLKMIHNLLPRAKLQNIFDSQLPVNMVKKLPATHMGDDVENKASKKPENYFYML